ncbi:MAG TPA: DnaJ domain-containing protein [Myxococcaceae bacterium]|nr:DnaJ domain-containing protein [Myxococcaceae bacterium]
MSKPPPNTSGRPPAVAPPRAPKAASAAGSPVRPAVVAAPAARLDLSAMTQLNALAARLNTLDYFQLLSVATSATPPEIKAAFHRWSRAFHPDRFYQVADKELKQRVNEVYKRITEAYYVLRDDVKRKAYLSDISSPERAKKLRFTEAAELETKAAVRKEQEEQIGTHPKGRQFFQAGMADFDAQKWAAAERNFKMALTFEPANPRYKEKLAEAQERNYQESKKAGEPFKIR